MLGRDFQILAIALAASLLPALAKAQDAGLAEHECDILASAPEDPGRPHDVDGVARNKIDIVRAEAACRRAVQVRSTARGNYELGRVLLASGHNEEGASYLRAAADSGYTAAFNDIGAMEKDERLAVAWFRRAAERGMRLAQYNLGRMYALGSGVPQSDACQAFFWFSRAAEQGLASAEFEIGVLYENGAYYKNGTICLQADAGKAAAWYRKAADQGHAAAQNNLGLLYQNGKGVLLDHAAAFRWFKLAAAGGSTMAENNLGDAYEKGYAVSPNITQAEIWYRKAAANGNNLAKNNLARLQREAALADGHKYICRPLDGTPPWILTDAATNGVVQLSQNASMCTMLFTDGYVGPMDGGGMSCPGLFFVGLLSEAAGDEGNKVTVQHSVRKQGSHIVFSLRSEYGAGGFDFNIGTGALMANNNPIMECHFAN